MPRFLTRSMPAELKQRGSKEAGVARAGRRSNEMVRVKEANSGAMFRW